MLRTAGPNPRQQALIIRGRSECALTRQAPKLILTPAAHSSARADPHLDVESVKQQLRALLSQVTPVEAVFPEETEVQPGILLCTSDTCCILLPSSWCHAGQAAGECSGAMPGRSGWRRPASDAAQSADRLLAPGLCQQRDSSHEISNRTAPGQSQRTAWHRPEGHQPAAADCIHTW